MYQSRATAGVITGGSGVLCSAIAEGLASQGMRTALLSRDSRKLEGVAQRVRRAGGDAIVLPTDVLSRQDLERAAGAIREELGPVDFLVNCAGGNQPGATTSHQNSFFDLPEDAVRNVLDVNFMGTFLACQVFGQLMAEQGEGVVLNIASMTSYRPLTRTPAYSAAKAAVANFTQWLAVHMAQEYSPRIRVVALAPGFFLTEQNRFLLTNKNGELTDRGRTIIDHTPMGRFGEPEDLLGAVKWLVSPEAAFVTGVVIPIDGGFSAFPGV